MSCDLPHTRPQALLGREPGSCPEFAAKPFISDVSSLTCAPSPSLPLPLASSYNVATSSPTQADSGRTEKSGR